MQQQPSELRSPPTLETHSDSLTDLTDLTAPEETSSMSVCEACFFAAGGGMFPVSRGVTGEPKRRLDANLCEHFGGLFQKQLIGNVAFTKQTARK